MSEIYWSNNNTLHCRRSHDSFIRSHDLTTRHLQEAADQSHQGFLKLEASVFTQEVPAAKDAAAGRQEVVFKQETGAAILKLQHSGVNNTKDAWKTGKKEPDKVQLPSRRQKGYIDGLENIMDPNRDQLSFYR